MNLKAINWLCLFWNKVLLIFDSPFKYAREKLGKDKYGNPMFYRSYGGYKDTL